MVENKNFGDMLKKHDDDKAATRQAQQSEAEAQRQLAAEARQRSLLWFNNVFEPTITEINSEMKESSAVFEHSHHEIQPGHFKADVFLSRRAFKSQRYAFYFRNDFVTARCEIVHNAVGIRNPRPSAQMAINEHSAISKYHNVPMATANATWVRRALQDILEENLKSM